MRRERRKEEGRGRRSRKKEWKGKGSGIKECWGRNIEKRMRRSTV
jgi:hypothetical protein